MKAIILYMWTVYVGHQPVYIQHARTKPEERAYVLEQAFQNAAIRTGAPKYLLLALAWTETALDGSRVGDAGETGIMQLHPRSPAGRAYARSCPVPSRRCDALSIELGAEALARGYDACGTWKKAIGFYKSGKCLEGPQAARTMAIWDWTWNRFVDNAYGLLGAEGQTGSQ